MLGNLIFTSKLNRRPGIEEGRTYPADDLIGFFICFTIELAFQGSFQGVLLEGAQVALLAEKLMYFSFITLMTIGYGDILPVTDLAQKAAMLIGLLGQFYLVIITAVVVGKFIMQKET